LNLGGLGLYRKFIISIIGEGSRLRLRGKLLKKMPKNAVCAELGVMDGLFSKKILNITKPKKLILIDVWMVNQTFTDPISQSEYDLKYNSVKEKFKSRPEVEIMRGRTDLIKTFPDNYFDWVYIDVIYGVIEAVDEFVKTHEIKKFKVFDTQFMIKLK